tara:strand:+ start:559 stop:921 length:363 start_codon:yes stop_codon:yes gene_type:complete
MNTSTLIINGVTLDKSQVLQLIQSNRNLQAIKLIREQAKIGLKESKDIVDILTFNPDFYPNGIVSMATEFETHDHSSPQKLRRSHGGSHIIQSKTSQRKHVMIIFVLASIITLMYFSFIK